MKKLAKYMPTSDKIYAIRNERKKLRAQLKALKTEEDKYRDVLTRAILYGVTLTGDDTEVSTRPRAHIVVTDKFRAIQYLSAAGDTYLQPRQINKTKALELLDKGVDIPGVERTITRTLSVRKKRLTKTLYLSGVIE